MVFPSVPKETLNTLLQIALLKTYGRDPRDFRNESDFKMKLFHNLSTMNYMGVSLLEKRPGHKTPVLHAEGKCENGNPAKADLLICNPSVFQKFNYAVDYIIELKHKLSRKDVLYELKKIRSYKRTYKTIYIISAQRTAVSLEQFNNELTGISQDIEIIQPDLPIELVVEEISGGTIGYNEAKKVVLRCIEKCLLMYGEGRQQFQGFFWCNYEHELNKKQTYPCEGDFVCQLYHALRNSLPRSVNIESEVLPIGTRNRIDLVVSSKDKNWCIPVDVKMNWDQFKHKYDQKTGDLKTPEASLIISRYKAVSSKYLRSDPITVVIQGHLAQETDKRRRSVEIFQAASFRHTLAYYDERQNKPVFTVFNQTLV